MQPGCVASDAGWPAATGLECLVCLAAGVSKMVEALLCSPLMYANALN